MHVEGARETRSDGQKALNKSESKYFKITIEMLHATQEAITTKSMTPGQDPDNFVNERTRLRNLLAETEEPITGQALHRHRQGLTGEYLDVKLVTWKDPHFHLPKVQSVLLYVASTGMGCCGTRRQGLLGVARPSQQHQQHRIPVACSATTAARRGITGAVVTCLSHGKSCECAGHKRNLDWGVGKKWRTVHGTITHNDAECYAQGPLRSQTDSGN